MTRRREACKLTCVVVWTFELDLLSSYRGSSHGSVYRLVMEHDGRVGSFWHLEYELGFHDG